MSTFASASHSHTTASAADAAPTSPARLRAVTGEGDRIGELLIDRELNGPRRSANGGFAAGYIAQHVDSDTVTVVLRRPIPVGRRLEVRDDADGGAVVADKGRAVAQAYPGRLSEGVVPAAPSFADALLARSRYPLAGVRHPLADCVVCGPERVDGMHVTPGPAPADAHRLAAPWTVDVRFSHAGLAQYAAVWGALDCPSYPARALATGTLCLLGTMTARVERRPRVGEHLVVHSWTREERGRRFETSAAMVDSTGEFVARADSTWVAVKHQRAIAAARWLR